MAIKHKSVDVRNYTKSPENQYDKSASLLSDNSKPIGIAVPLQLSGIVSGGIKMRYSPIEQIRDNFRNLILTNYGTRVMKPEFGTNLRSVSFDVTRDEFTNEVQRRIQSAINKYMPFISLENIEIVFGKSQYSQNYLSTDPLKNNNSSTTITIEYSVSALALNKDVITVVLV